MTNNKKNPNNKLKNKKHFECFFWNLRFGTWNFLSQRGYVAISSMLIIAAVVLSIGISVSLLSVSEIQMGIAEKERIKTVNLIEACTDEALFQLNESNTIASTISLPEGVCSVTINTQSGKNWTFTITATQNTYTKSIQVTANRGSIISLTSWQEQ